MSININNPVTETVEQIMHRPNVPKNNKLSEFIEINSIPNHRLIAPINNPLSSQFNNQITKINLEQQTILPLQPRLLVDTNFIGATFDDTIGYVPPDSMGAVGPTQVLVIVNGRIKLYSKNGTLGILDTDTDNFFNSVRDDRRTADPRVCYDRLSQRWFVTMINIGAPNRILIAVSSGSVITSFTFFQFQHDQVGNPLNVDTGGFADYDTLGVDRHALYIGVNVFDGITHDIIGTTGYVVNKADLIAGNLKVKEFRQMGAANGSGPGIWTPLGVSNDNPNSTEGYFIGVDNISKGKLSIMRISNPEGIPTISGPFEVNVPNTTFPILQTHKESNVLLSSVDDRLFQAVICPNKITGEINLWTAHNIETNNLGIAIPGGGRNATRWYEIGDLTGTPTLIQSGTLYDSNSSNPRGYWIPSVIASGQGHMTLGCSYASNVDYVGVAVAGRLRTDLLGTITTPTLAVISSTPYSIPVYRWGDYSATVVDPNDNMTTWTFQEYVYQNVWAVQVIKIQAPPPASILSIDPTTLLIGQSSVSLTITGSSSNGSEFFDPGNDTNGPGFVNRLRCIISDDVYINKVTFVDPTHIILDLDTTYANVGIRNITIYNPDGQNTTTNNILTLVGSPDFSLDTFPVSTSLIIGSSINLTVNITAIFDYTGTVDLSLSNFPPYISYQFNPSSILNTGTSTLTIQADNLANIGAYNLTVTGTDGTLTHTNQITITVVQPGFSLAVQPASRKTIANSTTTYSINVTSLNGFSNPVTLLVSNLPNLVAGSFTPTSLIPPANSTLKLTIPVSATPSIYPAIIIYGISESKIVSTNISLNITSFKLAVYPNSLIVKQGKQVKYTISIYPLAGFTGKVNLSLAGLPRKTTGNFKPTSINTNGTSTLLIKTTKKTRRGKFILTIRGTIGRLTKSVNVRLTVR